MERAINAVVRSLSDQLADELVSIYLYGSVEQPYYQEGLSDVNLLVIIGDRADMDALRAAFLPVWRQHEPVLRRPPAIARYSATTRHLRLFPLLGWHLAQQGRCLWGEDTLPFPGQAPPLAAWLAYLAHEALLGSAALAPNLLDETLAKAAYWRLHRVARILAGAPLDGEPPAAVLFAQIQVGLRRITSTVTGEDEPAPVDDALAPNLEGIYGETDRMVVLLPPLSEQLLQSLDWQAIAGRLAAHHRVLQATTAQQLILIQQYETAVDFVLGRYQHVWGRAPLSGLALPMRGVLKAAARTSSRLLVEGIGGDYVTAGDGDALHRLIHDYQNMLLNIGLQHELLHRAHGLPAAEPVATLPPRTAPSPERLRGLADQLDWWAAYYARELETATAGYVAAV